MKLSDLSDLSKEDILSALGLAKKRSPAEGLWGGLGIFAGGLLVGAAAALLLAPKSGQELREDVSERLRKARQGEAETTGTAPSQGEARA
jgi:hypothetical protein